MSATNWKAMFDEFREQDRIFFRDHPGLNGGNADAESQVVERDTAREMFPGGSAQAHPPQEEHAVSPESVRPDLSNSQRKSLWQKYYGAGSGAPRDLAGPLPPDTWSDGTSVFASAAALDLWIETRLSGETVPPPVKEAIFRQQESELEELRRDFWAAYLLSPTELSREALQELVERLERNTGDDLAEDRLQKTLHELLLCVQQRVLVLDAEWQQGQKTAREKLELRQEDAQRRVREAQN